MGILLIGIIFIIVGVASYKIGDNNYKYDFLEEVGLIVMVIGSIVVISSMLIILYTKIGSPADKAKMDEQYNSLCYKAESSEIRDNFGISNKSYIDEIQQWNMDAKMYKEINHNFFLGLFVPEYLGNYKTIDLKSIK